MMSVDPEMLIWVKESSLPPEARALLDPDVPLPADTIVFVNGPNALDFGLRVAALTFMGAVCLAFVSAVPGAFDTSTAEGIGIVVVALGAGFVADLFRRSVTRAATRRRNHREGRLREGLFLTDDRAVFKTPDGCFQIPRTHILDVRIHTPPGSGSRVSSPEFMVEPEDGDPFPVRAVAMYADGVQQIARAAAAWAKG